MMQQVAPQSEEPLLDGNAHSVRYGETIHDGSGKPQKVNSREGANSENFVMGSDAAEFVNKVKDQVRNTQKRISNVAESGEEHSIIWGMFMATTLNAATFMGKNFSTMQSVVNFDTMPTRHQPDFKKALSTMYRLKKAEDEKQYAKWSQSSSSWWQWQTNWRESDYENSPH